MAATADRNPDLTPEREAQLIAELDAGLAEIAERNRVERDGRRNLWLAHHWPDHYDERCIEVGNTHVCRRCASLYPLGIAVAVLAATGVFVPWPEAWDPWPIWLLSIPATVAYCGEALGFFDYRPRVQVITTLIAAVAFGRALGYEFVERGSWEFWGPINVFGLVWFLATAAGWKLRKRHQ